MTCGSYKPSASACPSPARGRGAPAIARLGLQCGLDQPPAGERAVTSGLSRHIRGRPRSSAATACGGAVLACGPCAVISHESAGALWGIRCHSGVITVSVPAASNQESRHPSPTVASTSIAATRHGIPVTTPTATIIDLAAVTHAAKSRPPSASRSPRPDQARSAPGARRQPRMPGVAKLKTTIDRRTFTFTRSQLERHFLPIARRAGLPKPLTCVYVNGFEVDFYWPELGLVVETDGRAITGPRAAGSGSPARPGPYRRRPHAAALHPRADHVRAGLRARNPHHSRARLRRAPA